MPASASMPRTVRKVSMRLRGKATSVALEPAFWTALATLARGSGLPLQTFVENAMRHKAESVPLASFLQVYALENHPRDVLG